MNTSGLPRVALIAGPTASGKSALAMTLATRLGGTIINADSAQVYSDLAVLTARPTPVDEARVPHLLYGRIDAADDDYSAARWAVDAAAAIRAVLADGRLPILVGGTGLYIRTLLDGIAPVPSIDPAIRAAVRALSASEAHAALAALDAAGAARLHANDTQRIARALEVMRSTGRSLAAWQADREGGIADQIALAAIVLDPPRAELAPRIDARFAEMLDAAKDEALALACRDDVPADAPIRRAIGVREAIAFHTGVMARDAAVAAGGLATRQYAKRQATWFRHQLPAAQRMTMPDADAIAAMLTTA